RLLNEDFDCILLDESTSSLDKHSVDIVEECILSKKDLTVIAITHHLTSKAIEMSDCILKLEDGKLVPVTM
ncbi:MAG: ABC transporter ATP-binding protein, partial [Finegoldia magna]|nr:ABC transporter ATP-binding protein [Finegoldia magna]